jgi:type II secretory pathway component PulF
MKTYWMDLGGRIPNFHLVGMATFLRRSWMRLHWTTEHRADFYELLAGFAADGLPVYEALVEMNHQYARHGHPLAELTRQLLAAMRGAGGAVHSLGSALHGRVPVVEGMAVRSGEDAGDVASGLARAAGIARVQQRMSQVIRGELIYPAFLLLLFALLLIGLATHVVPTLSDILPESRWPASAQAMATLARATPSLMAGIAVLGLMATVGFIAARSRWTGELRNWADRHLFPFTLHRRVSGALLLSSLGALLQIGLPFSLALSRLAEHSGAWERAQLARIRGRLRRGEREGTALAGPLFDPDLRWQLELYGRISRFSEALASFSDRALVRTEARIRSSFAVLRTLLLVVIAGLIFWVYSAFMGVTLAARSLG